jgi:Na+-driven multidrug efflux pump
VVLIPLFLVGYFFSTDLSILLGARDHIIPMTASYIQILLMLSAGFVMYGIFKSFTRNDGAPRAAMIGSIIFNSMNILWDYVFVIRLSLGMRGVALATTLAATIAFVFLAIRWLLKKTNFRLVKSRLIMKDGLTIFKIGGPVFISEFLYGFVIVAFNIALLRLEGNVGVAAFGIVSGISFVVYCILAGLGQGIQPLASHYYGLRNSENLKKILNYALLLSIGITAIVTVIVFLFTDPIASILNAEQDVALAELTYDGIRIYFTAFVFAGITMVCIAFLSVTSAQTAALIISTLQNGALIIPLVFLLPRMFGLFGVWSAYPVAEFLLVVASLVAVYKANRYHKKMFMLERELFREDSIEVRD